MQEESLSLMNVIDSINGVIWSPVLIYTCLAAGLFFSVLTRFVQLRLVKEMIRLLFSGQSSEKGVSSFQALAVSLSGRVGTGNIVGVAAAIGFGGPGAVFWMWVVAFLGASTAYVESTLGQIYKEEHEGQYRGGPAFYIEKATGQKWYGMAFALATILACGVLLPTVQSNAIGNAVELAFGSGEMIDTTLGNISSTKIIMCSVVVIILGFIIFGGLKRIAKFAEIVVPFMALAYIIVAAVVVALNIDRVPEIFSLIIGDALSPMAGFGAAIGWGVMRGVYSNEAGQGTGPHAAAAAEVQHPAQQGLVQAFSVYIDTLFICSATAFMILITGTYDVMDEATTKGAFEQINYFYKTFAVDLMFVDPNSPAFTQYAIESVFPGVGKVFVAIALFFFSFTTILAYYYIAETNVSYILRSVKIPGAFILLKIILMSAVFYGGVKAAALAWGLGDIGVGLMAWLNIVGIVIIFFIAKPAIKALKDYEEQRKRGVENYTFDPKALGIKHAELWEKKLEDS